MKEGQIISMLALATALAAPAAAEPATDRMGNFEIQDIKAPRDAASGQANGFEEIVFTAKDQPNGAPGSAGAQGGANARTVGDTTLGDVVVVRETGSAPNPGSSSLYFEDSVRTARSTSDSGGTSTQSKYYDASSPLLGVKNGGAPAEGVATNGRPQSGADGSLALQNNMQQESRVAAPGADGFLIEPGSTSPETNNQKFIGETVDGTNIRTAGAAEAIDSGKPGGTGNVIEYQDGTDDLLIRRRNGQDGEQGETGGTKFIGETEKNLNSPVSTSEAGGTGAANQSGSTPKPAGLTRKQKQKAAKVRRNQSGN